MTTLDFRTATVLSLFLFLLAGSGVARAGICSDEMIDQYLESPVEDTLSNTRVTYAADFNFKEMIASSNRPLMVLIYNNDQVFSKGLAALTACVIAEFPQFKLIAYDVRELNDREIDKANNFTGGMARKVPSLYIYRYKGEQLELAGSIKEGYSEANLVKKQIIRISEFIWNKVLR